jgi:hypothetical protein
MKGIYATSLKAFEKDYLIRDNKFYFPLKNAQNETIDYEIYEQESADLIAEHVFDTPKKQGIWHSYFHPDRTKTQKVFIFNRVIDAISYYQIYRPKIDFSTSAFVSLGSGVGKESYNVLKALYPLPIKPKYHSAFTNDFSGLIYGLALEQRINTKFDFQLGSVEAHFECTINGTDYKFDWTDLDFKKLFSEIQLKPKLHSLYPKLGDDFHEMLLFLQNNSKGSGKLISERTKI